jgi:hypothetical protein
MNERDTFERSAPRQGQQRSVRADMRSCNTVATLSPALFFGLFYLPHGLLEALGGVTAVVFRQVEHAADLDSDTRYFVWYLFKPILRSRMALGAVPVGLAGLVATKGSASPTGNMLLHVPAGFSEWSPVRLLDKAATAFLRGEATPSGVLSVGPKPTPVDTTIAGEGDTWRSHADRNYITD